MAAALFLLAALFQLPNAVATFDGTFMSANHSSLELRVENGETMRMQITHGTRFVRDGKAARAADFHEGESVTVDAERDVRLNLLARRVELAKGKTPK